MKPLNLVTGSSHLSHVPELFIFVSVYWNYLLILSLPHNVPHQLLTLFSFFFTIPRPWCCPTVPLSSPGWDYREEFTPMGAECTKAVFWQLGACRYWGGLRREPCFFLPECLHKPFLVLGALCPSTSHTPFPHLMKPQRWSRPQSKHHFFREAFPELP